MWGVEDLDLGLKAWLLGHPIVQDPECFIGHRFQTEFHYAVPLEHVVANALRMARKNFGDDTWSDWVQRYRRRKPEWPWDTAWRIFEEGQESLKREREYLCAHRVHDEFWYAAEFEVGWPLGLLAGSAEPATFTDPQASSCNAGTHESSVGPRVNANGCDHRRGLLIEHQRHPRNRAILADARISASTRTSDGAALTLFVKLTRTGRGLVEVERVTFQSDRDDPVLPYASLLTQRVAGRPLNHVRSVQAKDLLEAFGASAENSLTAQTVVDAWQKCLSQI